MIRLTVKDLKKAMRGLPDDSLVVLRSDSEGNNESTLLFAEIDKVGYKHKITEDYTYIGGQDAFGIDQEKDKGKYILVLTPSL